MTEGSPMRSMEERLDHPRQLPDQNCFYLELIQASWFLTLNLILKIFFPITLYETCSVDR